MADVRVQRFASTARCQLSSMGEQASGRAGGTPGGVDGVNRNTREKRRECIVRVPASGWMHRVPICLPEEACG